MRLVVTLFIRDHYDLGSTLFPGHLGAGLGGGDHLDLVTVGGGQGHLTLRLAVHIQRSLADLHFMILDQNFINDVTLLLLTLLQ